MNNNIIFPFSPNLKHYEAAYFIVRCFDDRFREMFEKFISSRGITHYDVESPAGGAKIFASPEQKGDCFFMLHELEKSIRLHQTKRVMLFTHHDCGAYGGLAKFNNNKEAERAYHADEHIKARDAVAHHFPNILIESFFLDSDGVISLS